MKIHDFYFLWGSRANNVQEKPITNFNGKRGQLPFYNSKINIHHIHLYSQGAMLNRANTLEQSR